MKAIMKNNVPFAAAAMACSLAVTHPYCPHNVMHYTPRGTQTVVANTINVNVQNECMSMAENYLRANKLLTVKEYARTTGLDKKQAKAELDAFATPKAIPSNSSRMERTRFMS